MCIYIYSSSTCVAFVYMLIFFFFLGGSRNGLTDSFRFTQNILYRRHFSGKIDKEEGFAPFLWRYEVGMGGCGSDCEEYMNNIYVVCIISVERAR